MCGWIGKGILARSPKRVNSVPKDLADIGPPRSEENTCGDGSCWHCRRRRAHIERRKFLATLGGAAAWPLAARAQQPRRVSIIGVLWHAGSAEEEGSNFKALVKGFRDLGYR